MKKELDKESYNQAIEDVAKMILKKNLYKTSTKLTAYQQQYNGLVMFEVELIRKMKK